MDDAAVLTIDRKGPVAILAARRPAVLNALIPDVVKGLIRAVLELGNDPAARAIVVTGTGRAFMAGADVGFMSRATSEEFRTFVEEIQELTRVIRACPIPVVAAVNGPAAGAGCEIACACDVRIASSSATFSFPESRIGLVVTSGVSRLLPRLVGRGWARRLLLTGDTIDANEALRIGLVEEVVAPDALMDAAQDFGRRVADAERLAITLSKRLLEAADETALAPALRLEVEAILSCLTEGKAAEGLAAFLEKREPSYRGETVR